MGLMGIHPDENVPLSVDEKHGVIRILGTRLRLETVIGKYYQGHTEPEDIVRSYDTLTVEKVERIFEWYQTRRDEVDEYMAWSAKEAEGIRAEYEPRIAQFNRLKERQFTQVQAQPI